MFENLGPLALIAMCAIGALIFKSHVVISTGLLEKGLRSEFMNRLSAMPTQFGELSTRIPSTSDAERYRWLGTVPNMREFGNGRQAKGLRTESYDVANLKYEATLEVDRDELSDDQTGQIMIRVGELAQRAATHKDYLLAQLLINGGATGFNSYDGVTFFNDAHASGASGNQDNDLTQAAADGTTPTVPEFRNALKNSIEAMLAFKDDQGEPMVLGATGLAIVVPPQLVYTAMEAVNATLISNTTNVLQGVAKVVPFPWLTDAAVFYTLKTDGVIRPFVFQDREPLEFNSVTDPSEAEVFKREKLLFGVRARYRMTYGYWQYAVRTTFT